MIGRSGSVEVEDLEMPGRETGPEAVHVNPTGSVGRIAALSPPEHEVQTQRLAVAVPDGLVAEGAGVGGFLSNHCPTLPYEGDGHDRQVCPLGRRLVVGVVVQPQVEATREERNRR